MTRTPYKSQKMPCAPHRQPVPKPSHPGDFTVGVSWSRVAHRRRPEPDRPARTGRVGPWWLRGCRGLQCPSRGVTVPSTGLRCPSAGLRCRLRYPEGSRCPRRWSDQVAEGLQCHNIPTANAPTRPGLVLCAPRALRRTMSTSATRVTVPAARYRKTEATKRHP